LAQESSTSSLRQSSLSLTHLSMAPTQDMEITAEPEVLNSAQPDDLVDDTADAGDASPLKRTQSQLAKHIVVKKVVERAGERRVEVSELRRSASFLGRQDTDESMAAQETLAAVEQEVKRVRNFGEDLLEDMLALDALAGLHLEDRATRKAAISELESFLGDVDGAKAKLAAVRGRLQKKIEEAQAEEARASPAAAPVVVTATRDTAPERLPVTCPGTRSPAPPMSADFWRHLRLPLRFQCRENRDGFTAVAAMPRIEGKDLQITFSDDFSTLSVVGLRLPSTSEAAQLQRYLETELGPGFTICPEHYLEAGRGAFGRFEETLRLPQDVNVDGITASHERGALCIQMPRRKRFSPVGAGRPLRGRCDLGASLPSRWPLAVYPGSARRNGGNGLQDSFGFF